MKFFQKEDIIPADADRPVFKWAPALVLLSAVGLFVVIPFGEGDALVVRNLDIGIFYALAISSIGTIGILMAGWSSANKYSLMGGLRAAGQLIAYELPLVLSVIGVVVLAETMSLNGIAEAQASWGIPFIVPQLIGFVVFYIAALAEMSRIPFDMPIAESELVTGFLTEYSGFRFLFFFLAEFANMFTFAAIASTLFLGGYEPIFFDLPAAFGPLVLASKIGILEDQLQAFAWKWLIPISLINIAVTAVFKVVF